MAGYGNTATGVWASIPGGYLNTASGEFATVSGGQGNAASGAVASVGGGGGDKAEDVGASVSGGQDNAASGVVASVSGGFANAASGELARLRLPVVPTLRWRCVSLLRIPRGRFPSSEGRMRPDRARAARAAPASRAVPHSFLLYAHAGHRAGG